MNFEVVSTWAVSEQLPEHHPTLSIWGMAYALVDSFVSIFHIVNVSRPNSEHFLSSEHLSKWQSCMLNFVILTWIEIKQFVATNWISSQTPITEHVYIIYVCMMSYSSVMTHLAEQRFLHLHVGLDVFELSFDISTFDNLSKW